MASGSDAMPSGRFLTLQALRDLTQTPPASQVRLLRAALSPAAPAGPPAPPQFPPSSPVPPEAFLDRLSGPEGSGLSFRERLAAALAADMDELYAEELVADHGPDEHARPGRRCTRPEQVEEMAGLANGSGTQQVFGRLSREIPRLVLGRAWAAWQPLRCLCLSGMVVRSDERRPAP